MTVFLPRGRRTWRYDFEWKKQRYVGSTDQVRKEDAALFESKLKLQLRQEAGGIGSLDPARTPRFSNWAPIYYDAKQKRVTRPDLLRRTLDVVLQFFAGPPSRDHKRVEGAPYHDLRLGDPIANPAWIERFEAWMDTRQQGEGVSGSTKNSYRSCLSGMYRVALWPRYRAVTGVRSNPFLHLERDRTNERITTLTVKQLRTWIAEAPYHVQLALVIAALAPKLRLRNILELEWQEALRREVDLHHRDAAQDDPPRAPAAGGRHRPRTAGRPEGGARAEHESRRHHLPREARAVDQDGAHRGGRARRRPLRDAGRRGDVSFDSSHDGDAARGDARARRRNGALRTVARGRHGTP